MRIVFLGTPDFAVPVLRAIYEYAGKDLIAVICNKDKPTGRKQVLTPPPTKVLAEQLNVPVFQYDSIKKEGVNDLKDLSPDIMVTCAFGQILSQEILDVPKLGVINVHASLLPKYRGASPIQYAIMNGEKETGITIMKTDIGIDTGDIILQKSIKIGETETGGELFDRLSVLGAECITEALSLIESGNARYIKQDDEKATYTKMIRKETALIEWDKSAEEICDQIRAFCPFPAAYTFLNGLPFKIYKAEVVNLSGNVGEILKSDGALIVGAGKNAVSLLRVCRAGGKIMDISEFLRGNRIETGTKLS